jgi:aminomethyltransferase
MNKIGFDFPEQPRKTILTDVEDNWYMPLLAKKLGRDLVPAKKSNFGQYDMAVNYITSVIEESKAVEKVAIYNIDHMAQIKFEGKDVVALLDRTLPANVASMKIGQCKYTLLLNEEGGVQDDLIIMRVAEEQFILVINAGHDLTGKGMDHGHEVEFISDADRILKYKKENEDVTVTDISDDYAKIDVQGPYGFRLIKELYGLGVLKNRNKPAKNMAFFTFNEFEFEGYKYFISRTGYTNRWGWELYVPAKVAPQQFKRIVEKALELDGLLVGLGGRDENRISAGANGLPLMGQEYRPEWIPVNTPLFNAACDMTKENFVGKEALAKVIDAGCNKRMAIVISEGIVVDRDVYLNGKKIGICTSSINSPNITQEKREFIGSKRKSVNGEDGIAAIGLVWLEENPFELDAEGKEVLEKDGKAVRIPVEFFRVDADGNPKGRPSLGYISADGINEGTAPKPLKRIQDL